MTTDDLSRILGLSRATVSRALNNHPHVKAETRQRVLRAIEESGHVPNMAIRNVSMKPQVKIGVIVFSQPATFWEQIHAGVDRAKRELAGSGASIDYIVTDILRPQEQTEVIEQLVAQGYKGIALAPNHPAIVADAVDKAIEAGVSVVLFNVDIPNVNRMAYVGSDYTRAGMLAAELIAKTTPGGQGGVAIMTLEDTLLPIEQRTTGFRLALAEYPGMRVASVCRFPRVGGGFYERTCELIESGDVNAIYNTIGELDEVARAVYDKGAQGRVVLVGYDLDKTTLDYLRKGVITATIGHEAQEQSRQALLILSAYLMEGTLPLRSLNYTKLEVIMRHNADSYMY